MTEPPANYDAVKCPTCGRVWIEHMPDCPRHPYRPDPEWVERARRLRREWEARRRLAEQNRPEQVP